MNDELVTEKGDWRTVLKRLNLHGVESSKDESFTTLNWIFYSNQTSLMEFCFDVTGYFLIFPHELFHKISIILFLILYPK